MVIKILEQVPLAPFTTMRVGGNAKYFTRVHSVEGIKEAILFARENGIPFFVLGGGSNTLFFDDGFFGLVIKIEIQGIFYDDNIVTVSSGEIWDDIVSDVVSRNLWGIENLSLIPGTVGGAIVQNIGAYGAEVCDAVLSVEAFDMETMQVKKFLHDECEFAYRESIFKKNKNLIVVSVSFSLMNERTPSIGYEDVKNFFEERKIIEPSLLEIREAIVSIRNTKMPALPIGTAGSFFKNPLVSNVEYEALKKVFPEIKAYLQGNNTVKLSAAWLLDKVGHWRGFRRGDAGVNDKQALILVNYGNASAAEIFLLANEMKRDIKQKTNVALEEEVVIIK